MNRITCPQEANVSYAARTGSWDDFSKAHVQQCPHCREVAGITEWMGHIAKMDSADAVLPGPHQIVLNARLAAIQAAREKALRPLAIIEFVVRIVVIFVLAGGVLGLWVGVRSLAAHLPSSYPHLPLPLVNSAAALVTCLITLAFTKLVQLLLIEE